MLAPKRSAEKVQECCQKSDFWSWSGNKACVTPRGTKLYIRVGREKWYSQVPVELSKGDADYRDAFRTPDSGKIFQVLGPMRSHHNILHLVPELCYKLMVNASRCYSQIAWMEPDRDWYRLFHMCSAFITQQVKDMTGRERAFCTAVRNLTTCALGQTRRRVEPVLIHCDCWNTWVSSVDQGNALYQSMRAEVGDRQMFICHSASWQITSTPSTAPVKDSAQMSRLI